MTNYNERLYKALSNLYNSAWVEGSNYKENNPEGSDIPSKREIAKTAAAKQAITSLIKELVAEAKPSKKHIGDEVAENRSYTGERLFNATIDEYHTSLLKALEEV